MSRIMIPDKVNSLTPRMMHLMEFFHPLVGNMRVDLGSGKIAVAQQQLYHSQISSMIQQVRGESVTQRMWRQ